MTDFKKFEDYTVSSTQPVYPIGRVQGSIAPLSLEGGDEPLVQVIKKVNEIIDSINADKGFK